jgi:hypothetical protein
VLVTADDAAAGADEEGAAGEDLSGPRLSRRARKLGTAARIATTRPRMVSWFWMPMLLHRRRIRAMLAERILGFFFIFSSNPTSDADHPRAPGELAESSLFLRATAGTRNHSSVHLRMPGFLTDTPGWWSVWVPEIQT